MIYIYNKIYNTSFFFEDNTAKDLIESIEKETLMKLKNWEIVEIDDNEKFALSKFLDINPKDIEVTPYCEDKSYVKYTVGEKSVNKYDAGSFLVLTEKEANELARRKLQKEFDTEVNRTDIAEEYFDKEKWITDNMQQRGWVIAIDPFDEDIETVNGVDYFIYKVKN